VALSPYFIERKLHKQRWAGGKCKYTGF
jgi:hypothetical protein